MSDLKPDPAPPRRQFCDETWPPLLRAIPAVWPGGMPWPRPPHIQREMERLSRGE